MLALKFGIELDLTYSTQQSSVDTLPLLQLPQWCNAQDIARKDEEDGNSTVAATEEDSNERKIRKRVVAILTESEFLHSLRSANVR